MIPADVLARGEDALLAVLRRKHPEYVFIVDDRPVDPHDADVPGQLLGRSSADDDAVEEALEHLAPVERVKAVPDVRERAARRNPGALSG